MLRISNRHVRKYLKNNKYPAPILILELRKDEDFNKYVSAEITRQLKEHRRRDNPLVESVEHNRKR